MRLLLMHYTRQNCNTLQHAATHCNTLQHTQHTAAHCNTLQHTVSGVLIKSEDEERQHTVTYRNTLQHTTTHRNTPQHTVSGVLIESEDEEDMAAAEALHTSKLQHAATHCNTLQHEEEVAVGDVSEGGEKEEAEWDDERAKVWETHLEVCV